ncbi:MAG: COX15/CtaA family protein [Cyclobacteriaceae bacterium]|nr:COX15/CtaA family protein [Cyclobacteriaceae bacterium]
MGHRGFYRLSLSTLIAVYILILVGGVVRSTGAGMGCPDWPKCFGQWVPPTSVEQLPPDYKEFYSEYRHQKNVRFARYLTAFGFSETANRILTDETIREEADFNPVKTWIEYMNRLTGVVIGFLIFAVFVYALRFRKTDRKITWIAGFTFVLVGFQGWIGSIVVSTNLTPWTITVHMFLAMVIVALLIYLVHVARGGNSYHVPGIMPWVLGCMLLVFVQIFLGTRVREMVDEVANQISDRNAWIPALGITFVIHRSFSWLVLVFHAVLLVKLWKTEPLKGFALPLFVLILSTILSGMGMAWFAVPPFLQPVHLLLATLTFGVEFYLALQVNRTLKPVLS